MTPLIPAVLWTFFANSWANPWPDSVPRLWIALARIGLLAGAMATTRLWWRRP